MIIRDGLKLHDDAAVLLRFVMKKDKAFLFTYPEKQLTQKQEKKFKQLIKQRSGGMPTAYLTGEKEFFGLKFKVTPDVLIPRLETESLIELVLKHLESPPPNLPRSRGGTAAAKPLKLVNFPPPCGEKFSTSPAAGGRLREGVKILDLGTGSGCIIISLGKALSTLPASHFPLFASDISKKALAVAKKNAKLHKVKITFKQGDLLQPWLARRSLGEGGKNHRFNIIVANLPYLPRLEDPSTKFEPKKALVAKKHGLALIEKLFQALSLRGVRSFDRTTKRRQRGPKAIFVEFDPRQTNQIKKLAKKYLPDYKLKIYKDLSGKNRFAVITSESDMAV